MAPLLRTIGLVYYRTSTHRQFKMISPDVQKHACLEGARNDGLEVLESRDFYCDDESAFAKTSVRRPGFERMTERWQSDPRVKAVYIYDLSRLFRDTRGYLNYKHEMRRHGVQLVSVLEPMIRDDSPAAKLPAGVIALVNEYTSELYGNKIRDAMRFKAESGVYPGRASFGYRNMREEDDKKSRAWIEPEEREVPWLQKAYSLFAEDTFTLRTLRDRLVAEGFPTRNGRPLSIAELQRILTNRLYIGWIQWAGVSNQNGTHEKLIDPGTFDRVQAILAAHNKGASRKRKHRFLLRGLAWCASCGSRIQAGYSTGGSGKKYAHYHCQKRQRNERVACAEPYVSVDALEKEFARLFSWYELTPDGRLAVEKRVKETLGNQQRLYESSKRALERSLADVQNAKTNAFLKYANQEVQTGVYEDASRALTAKETALLNQIDSLSGNLAEVLRAIELTMELTRNIQRTYRKGTPSDRALLASAFFERIEIAGGAISKAIPRPTAAFICRENLANSSVFELELSGGDRRSLFEHPEALINQASPQFIDLLERALRAVSGQDLSLAA